MFETSSSHKYIDVFCGRIASAGAGRPFVFERHHLVARLAARARRRPARSGTTRAERRQLVQVPGAAQVELAEAARHEVLHASVGVPGRATSRCVTGKAIVTVVR